jgi:hypothetical protein
VPFDLIQRFLSAVTGVVCLRFFVFCYGLMLQLLADPSYLLGAGWQEKSKATT